MAASSTAATPLWPPNVADGLPGLFVRLGWLGVWTQVLIIGADAAFLAFFLIAGERAADGFGLRGTLVIAGLLVMGFTTVWFFRYAALGRKMLDPHDFPDYEKVVGTLWVGLWASVIGIGLSLLLLYLATGRLLLSLLAAPQVGAAVVNGTAAGPSVSAFDGVSLMASLIVLTAEMGIIAMTLLLLFRTTGHARSADA
ncbi:MAG: DUF3611 family protein [Pseudomonadota bacterium]